MDDVRPIKLKQLGRTPLVSIVVPVFNRAEQISNCLLSICGQTYRNTEIIVVDDCSTDETLAAIALCEDPRLRVIKADRNGGAASARNLGVEAATGDLIAFQDSDDYWVPHKIEDQVTKILSLPDTYIGLYSGKIRYGKYGPGDCSFVPHPEDHAPSDQIFETTAYKNHVTMQTLMVRREVFDGDLRFDARLRANEDWEFTLLLARLGKIAFDPQPHCVAAVSADSISRGLGRNAWTTLYIVRKHRALLMAHPRALAQHFYGIARILSRLKKYRSANTVMKYALRYDRYNWRCYVATMLNSLSQFVTIPKW
ncbi:glycosyltransferase family 2 protein [Algihabitans albus]|uniref:glycosyltransferase family 2 protein n=1 Tax=Algihabitans albus TaxID=2164067 RepID=UPI0013C330E7|nr:glycosyltransferase family A protein [Algihabitans albus]